MRGGLPVCDLHFNLPQQRDDLFRLVTFHRFIDIPALLQSEFSLTSGTKNARSAELVGDSGSRPVEFRDPDRERLL